VLSVLPVLASSDFDAPTHSLGGASSFVPGLLPPQAAVPLLTLLEFLVLCSCPRTKILDVLFWIALESRVDSNSRFVCFPGGPILLLALDVAAATAVATRIVAWTVASFSTSTIAVVENFTACVVATTRPFILALFFASASVVTSATTSTFASCGVPSATAVVVGPWRKFVRSFINFALISWISIVDPAPSPRSPVTERRKSSIFPIDFVARRYSSPTA
jgi:hypothetical protein